MSLHGARTFVGFGFGAIQAGLFLYEAWASGAFGRLVVAEIRPELVAAVREADGYYQLNIAHAHGIEQVRVGPVEIYNPQLPAHRQALVDAIAGAQELATALPGVVYYAGAGPASPHRLLAFGLRRKARQGGPRAVIYTAENHPQGAASLLEARVRSAVLPADQAAVCRPVRFVDTVIGKMCGVTGDLAGLAPVTPNSAQAFLVEAFNRIYISQIHFGDDQPFVRGLAGFEEQADLTPYQEAKLYGHNAVHALAAYLGAACGLTHMAELRERPGMVPFLRAALLRESGPALRARHGPVPGLLASDAWVAVTDDLLDRILNPHLRDSVARVARDPARKLGWDDRLIGTMRRALAAGIMPRHYALGAAAALALWAPGAEAAAVLPALWGAVASADQARPILDLIGEGQQQLARWRAQGFSDLEAMFYIEEANG